MDKCANLLRGLPVWAAALCFVTLGEMPRARAGEASPPTIVVEGQRVPSKSRGEQLTQFVKSRGAPSKIGQLARWRAGICIKIAGLDTPFNDFIASRIRDIAKSVGAPISAPCPKPNIEILIVEDPQKTLDKIAQTEPRLFGYFYWPNLKRVSTMTHPIQSWYRTATRGPNGMEVGDDPYAFGPHASTPGGGGSNITSNLQSVLWNVLIVADRDKIAGHEIGAISDYLAVLALAPVKSLDDCLGIPSILDLMVEDCRVNAKPNSLTSADVSYLKALYSSDPEVMGELRIEGIAGQLGREIP